MMTAVRPAKAGLYEVLRSEPGKACFYMGLVGLVGLLCVPLHAQNRYRAGDGKLRVALAQQPLGPNGPSKGPDTMASGGIQKIPIAALNRMIAGAVRGVRAR